MANIGFQQPAWSRPLDTNSDSSEESDSGDRTLVNAYFDTRVQTKVTQVAGQEVTLSCRLKQNVGSSAVWFRVDKENSQKDKKLVNGERIRIKESSDGLEYTLKMKELEEIDSGHYECRLASRPYIKMLYILKVTEGGLFYPGIRHILSLLFYLFKIVMSVIT